MVELAVGAVRQALVSAPPVVALFPGLLRPGARSKPQILALLLGATRTVMRAPLAGHRINEAHEKGKTTGIGDPERDVSISKERLKTLAELVRCPGGPDFLSP